MPDPPASAAPNHVLIVGGGVSGLTAAYDLAQSGIRCTLVETGDRLGGVIRTERIDECLVEGGPDSFIAQKPWALELIRELGLADQVIGSNDERRRTYILRRGKLIPLPDGIQFLAPAKVLPVLTTRLLSPGAKVRMLLEWFRRPAPGAGDRSIADFVRDHYGRELNEYLAQPMLAGVYGGSPEELSLEAVMPRFLELERQYGSVSRGMLASGRKAPRPKPGASLFLTLKSGMQQLVDALVERIRPRARILHARAVSVRRTESGFNVMLADGVLEGDAVILATPAWSAAELLRAHDSGLADDLARIPYRSSITGAFLYCRPPFARPLDGFGFLAPRAEGKLLAACTWVNTKFDYRAPDSRAFLRAFLAGENAERHFEDSDAALAFAMESELRQIMGFQAQASTVELFRWDRAMAQYRTGHFALKRRIEERLLHHAGLYISGNAFDGIGVPDCIRRSRNIARTIQRKH